MCDYCNPNYIDTLTDMTAQIQQYGEVYGLTMMIHNVSYAVAINFCPMCGRNLSEPYDPFIEEVHILSYLGLSHLEGKEEQNNEKIY